MRRLALALLLASPAAFRDARAQQQPYVPEEEGDAPETIREDPDRPKLKLKGADPPASKEPDAMEADPRAHPVVPTTYQGVSPGAPNLPPRAPRLPVKGKQRLTWPGFQVVNGVPTVFMQLTGPVEWAVSERPGQIVYTLKQTTIHLRNNQRPLRVGEFDTAVKEVDARRSGSDVRVTINVKAKVGHRERTEDAAGGFKLLIVELPTTGN